MSLGGETAAVRHFKNVHFVSATFPSAVCPSGILAAFTLSTGQATYGDSFGVTGTTAAIIRGLDRERLNDQASGSRKELKGETRREREVHNGTVEFEPQTQPVLWATFSVVVDFDGLQPQAQRFQKLFTATDAIGVFTICRN